MATPVVHPPPLGKPGGRLTTIALVNTPDFDVHRHVQETLTSLGPGMAYSRLLRLRTGAESEIPQPSLLLECELCEKWEVLDTEPLTFRFHLRKGVLWHDISPVNGRELVADDVVYSYERLRTPTWANAPLLQNLGTVEAEDQYTLKIALKPGFPDADFLLSLADGHAKIVAKESVAPRLGLIEGPVIGSGPWIWKSTQKDVGSVLERNPLYFEPGLPFVDQFVTRVITGSEDRRLAAFATGAVDVYQAPPTILPRLNALNIESTPFISRRGGAGLILTMNVSAPPFDNPKVRKAVFKAIDPWDYVRQIWADQGYVSLGIPVKSPDWLLTREEIRGTYFADPTSANQLLRESGLPMPIKFELMVADFGNVHLQQGTELDKDLRSAGFDPTLVKVNTFLYQDRVWRDKKYQMAIGELPPTNTTNSYLLAILHSQSVLGNVSVHSDKALDAMIVEQAVESNSDKRRNLVRNIQQYLLEQAYLLSPVTGGNTWVSGTRVKGFFPNTAASEYFYWAKAWVE